MKHNAMKNNVVMKVLNNNILGYDYYTFEDIQLAFANQSEHNYYKNARIIAIQTKFFQECKNEEYLKVLVNDFKVNKRNIKNIYQSFSDQDKRIFGQFWATRFRIPLVSVKIEPILRNNERYVEIDNFNTYELTPCIAYEMAIRNEAVIALKARYEKITHMMSQDKYLFNKRYLTKDAYEICSNIEDKILLDSEYKNYENVLMQKFKTYSTLINADYKKFIDDYIDKCTELGMSDLDSLKQMLENELINEYLIYPTGYQRKVYGSPLTLETVTNKKKEMGIIKYDKDPDKIVYEEIIHESFTQMQGLYANSEEYFVNNIIPNFNRQVNDQNQITVSINFSLPLEEIIEYIETIKNKLNYKIPFEFLVSELNKTNDLTKINTIDSSGKEIILDTLRGEKPQYKLTDMLYIYDMKKLGLNNTEIRYGLDDFYHAHGITKSFDDKTIAKYNNIAKDYIENKRYMELIIGKSAF